MSLKVWLPLNGNLENQGASAAIATNNGTTVDTAGKIGSCYSFDGTDDFLTLNNFNPNGWPEISISAWVYPTADFVGLFLARGGSQHRVRISTNGFMFRDTNNTGTQREVAFSPTISPNIWTHITCVYKRGEIWIYQNGIQTAHSTAYYHANSTLLSDMSEFRIGRQQSTSGNTYYTGKVNDFRIYNHALSAAEVHEISQGLVLHYKLDSVGAFNDNIISGTDDWSTWYKGSRWTAENGILTYTAGSSAQWIDADSPCIAWSQVENKTLTVSVEVRSDDYNYTTGSGFSLCLVRKASGPDAVSYSNRRRECSPIYLQANQVTSEWKLHSHTYLNFTDADFNKTFNGGGGDWFGIYLWNYTNKNIQVRKIKVEIGGHATIWIPSSSDTSYPSGGFPKIIQDNSGYGNNGIINDTLILNSNTARYDASTYFNGTNTTIKIPFNSCIKTDDYTVSVWTYKSVIGEKNYQTILGGPSGFELEARSGSSTNPVYRIHNWGGGTAAYELNKWNLFTFTRNATESKLYVNGELKVTGTAGSAPPSGNYFIGAWKNTTSQNYDGMMSDFRLYATVLSEADIKQLYQLGAKVDNKGNLHCYEAKENAPNLMSKIDFARAAKVFQNGLSSYTQANCQVTLTDNGYRIYRPPNVMNKSNGGSNSMYGGLKLVNQTSDTPAAYDAARDNIWGLQSGHTYLIAFHAKGQSSVGVNFGWTHNMGNGVAAGITPAPTGLTNQGIPANFQGEKDCIYIFTINDSIIKTSTVTRTSSPKYVEGEQYLSYRHLTFSFGYSNTGELGTDLYLTNFRLYDVTSQLAQILKVGIANFHNFVEENGIFKIRYKSEAEANNLIEF